MPAATTPTNAPAGRPAILPLPPLLPLVVVVVAGSAPCPVLSKLLLLPASGELALGKGALGCSACTFSGGGG